MAKRNPRHVFAMLSMAFIGPSLAVSAEKQNEPIEISKTQHGAWDVVCSRLSDIDRCAAQQTLSTGDNGAIVGLIVKRSTEPSTLDRLVIQAVVPENIEINHGVNFLINEEQAIFAPVRRCRNGECLAETRLSEKLVSRLTLGEKLTAVYVSDPIRAVGLDFELRGLRAAIDALPRKRTEAQVPMALNYLPPLNTGTDLVSNSAMPSADPITGKFIKVSAGIISSDGPSTVGVGDPKWTMSTTSAYCPAEPTLLHVARPGCAAAAYDPTKQGWVLLGATDVTVGRPWRLAADAESLSSVAAALKMQWKLSDALVIPSVPDFVSKIDKGHRAVAEDSRTNGFKEHKN